MKYEDPIGYEADREPEGKKEEHPQEPLRTYKEVAKAALSTKKKGGGRRNNNRGGKRIDEFNRSGYF